MKEITKETVEYLMKNVCEYQGRSLEIREKFLKYYKTQEIEGDNTLRILIEWSHGQNRSRTSNQKN